MEYTRYRDAVADRAEADGYQRLSGEGTDFDGLWLTREEDPTVGDVVVLATVVDATDFDAADVGETADRLRDLLVDHTEDTHPAASTTPFGYVVFAAHDAGHELVGAAIRDYTVASRRTNVFPLVYDLDTGELHTHEVPRLKKRGLYRRQKDDAEDLFEI